MLPALKTKGFTLIELLLVIGIISLLSTAGYFSFTRFAQDQSLVKAQGEAQSVLRLAQSNATTSTMCNGVGSRSWYVLFTGNNYQLNCDPGGSARNYSLEDVNLTITGSDNCTLSNVRFDYATLTGNLTVISAGVSSSCLQSQTFTFSFTSIKNPNAPAKLLKITKGGAINVQ